MADREYEELPRPEVSMFSRLRFYFVMYFFMGLVKLVSALLALVKWLFAPIALVFDILVLLPFGRITVKVPAKPAFQEKQLDDLPDPVWRYFVQSRFVFNAHGFRPGRYLYNEDVMPGVGIYTMTMINPRQGIGFGLMYLQILKARDDSLDRTACEFTCIKDDLFVDMTNNSVLEPFLPTPGRIRLIMDVYSDEQLYLIHKKFVETADCRNNAKMLELLETNPRLLLGDEIRMLLNNNIKRGYMYREPRADVLRLTWKGALVSALQTLWPMSDFYRKKLHRMAHDYLAEFDIDAEQWVWRFDEQVPVRELERPVDSLSTAIALAAPLAAQHGMVLPPVSVAVDLKVEHGNCQVDLVDVRYESTQDFASRKMRWRGSFGVSLDNRGKQILVEDGEKDMYTHEEYEAYGLEEMPPLPERVDQLLDIADVVQHVNENRSHADEPMEGYLVLQMTDGRPEWSVQYTFGEQFDNIRLDAVSGERII